MTRYRTRTCRMREGKTVDRLAVLAVSGVYSEKRQLALIE